MKNLILAMTFITLVSSCEKGKVTKGIYEGENISKDASILRDKNTKAASLEIETDGKWELFAGNSVDSIDFSKPLAEGTGSGTFPLNVNNNVRSYFQLVTPKGKAILAEKHLPMTGGYNFRDLGGIRTTEGRYVKWGKIFRSDDLNKLTDADLSYLSAIPLVSIVDFRTKQEMEQAPDKVPASVKYEYACSIAPGNLSTAGINPNMTENEAMEMMKGLNVSLVNDSASINIYKDFFAMLQDGQKVPLMFHCSAGKDRTGMGAALILYALGVDDQTIEEDYLLSNTYLADKYAGYIAEYPAMKPLFEVNAAYLKSGIDYIKKEYGSVESYLSTVLEVDIAKLREMYLY